MRGVRGASRLHRIVRGALIAAWMIAAGRASAQVGPNDSFVCGNRVYRIFRTPDGTYYARQFVPNPWGTQVPGTEPACYQDVSPPFMDLRGRALGGCRLYRAGQWPRNQIVRGQFWSPMCPADPSYGRVQGIDNFRADWICSGRFGPYTRLITRPSPAWGTSPGGAPEVVCRNHTIHLETFSTGPFDEGDCLDYCGPGRRLANLGRRCPPTAPPVIEPPAPGGPGFYRNLGNTVQLRLMNCNPEQAMMAGTVVYVGGGLTADGLIRCSDEANPINQDWGIVEATGGSYLTVGGAGCGLTAIGFGEAGATVCSAAPPVAACVAVGTISYVGTRQIDNCTGGRISGSLAWLGCGAYDTVMNACWRWTPWGDGCNYNLTSSVQVVNPPAPPPPSYPTGNGSGTTTQSSTQSQCSQFTHCSTPGSTAGCPSGQTCVACPVCGNHCWGSAPPSSFTPTSGSPTGGQSCMPPATVQPDGTCR